MCINLSSRCGLKLLAGDAGFQILDFPALRTRHIRLTFHEVDKEELELSGLDLLIRLIKASSETTALHLTSCEYPYALLSCLLVEDDGVLLWPKLATLSLSSLVEEDSRALGLLTMLVKSRGNSFSSDLVVEDDSGRTLCEVDRIIMVKDRKLSKMIAQIVIDA